jgi:hypothetical protein
LEIGDSLNIQNDIFNAFVVGQEFVTLAAPPAGCAQTPPTGCILENGETIYVTLWTNIAQTGRKNFQPAPTVTYTAANSGPGTPVPTTTTGGSATTTFSSSLQIVPLTATVTSAASTVNQGSVTFQVKDGATNIGTPETSAPLTAGSASVNYDLPAGTAAKTYTIQATYSGGTNFDPSSGAGTLTVNAAPPTPVPTTTTVDPQAVTFSSAAQDVTLTASVAATPAANQGTITFQVVDAATNPVGTAVTSTTLNNGLASAIYALPAGLAAAGYTIQATYSGGTNFDASSGSGTLTVNAAPPPIQSATATTVGTNAVTFSSGIQHVALSAAVSVAGAIVNEGTVTFQVKDGATNVGAAVPSAPLSNGNASVSYELPAGTAAKNTYTVQATYSGGADFLASTGSGTLTINKAQSTTTFTSTPTATMFEDQTYTPTASSTGDGVLTIGVSGSCSIASGVVKIGPTAISGTCTVTATESAGNNFLGSSAADQTITVLAAFSVATSAPSITISAPGGSGTTTLNITGQPGFTSTINFSCTGLPAKSSCSFSPASVPGTGSTTITVTTTAPVVTMLKGAPGLNWWTAGGSITLAGVFLAGITGKRRRWSMLLGLLVVAFLLTVVGCGSSTSHNTIPGTPPGTSTVTVTGTSGTLTHSTTFTLTVQ